MSSEYARVYFYVPRNLKKADRLIEPVEIPIDDYIDIRYQEFHGNKATMAYYLMKHYLGNQEFSYDDVSMKIAAGCPMYVYDIDEIIESGGCPEIRNGEIIDKKKPQWQLDQEERFTKQLETERQEGNTRTDDSKKASNDKQFLLIMGGIALILILMGLLAKCAG